MKNRLQASIVLVIIVGLLLVGYALAAPVATSLERYVVGGGGGHIENGSYSLDGTIGQAITGVDHAAPYDLCSGFWCDAERVAIPYLYLPLIKR